MPSTFRAVEHPDARSFLDRAESFLMGAEDEHNLLLGFALEATRLPVPPEADAPLLVTVESDAGRVVGCAFRTPPHKLGVTRMPLAAVPSLVGATERRCEHIPAVLGPSDVATEVAREWVSRHGGIFRAGMRQRIYRLDRVDAPEGVPGRLRPAEMRDLPLVRVWGEGFTRDAGAGFRPPGGAHERWIAQRSLYLWEDEGAPVSMAVARGATPHGIRIGYVYTPPERRGAGYASILVAAVSQRMLDDGFRFCVLYTDLSNPTSNAIYQRIGYRPVCDVIDVEIA
ncbi:MAG TPA: GNAT family N-acetyltransferase [Longimicrobiales bacterium]|nr:GNAT family N-acetyltransferase [Longimicrobiales bacterium]